ncbi:MAG: oxygenase MpaB family protein [Acidimicrobiales bacterium]
MSDDGGVFPPDAVIRRVDGEAALLFGAGRALLLQLAHPSVARAVVEHSAFECDPLARLQGTLNASYTVVFGARDEAQQMAASIRRVHERVAGDGYAATDPSLLMWVHATLVDTALLVYPALVAPLGRADEEEYYRQSMVVAEMLGCPRASQPADLAAFRVYLRDTVCMLEVTPEAKRAAGVVLHPRLLAGGIPVSWAAGPALSLARFITVGTLPEPIRTQYGFAWDGRRDVALRLGAEMARRALAVVPSSMRRVA